MQLLVFTFALGLGSYVWADQNLQEFLQLENEVLFDGANSAQFHCERPHVIGNEILGQYNQFLDINKPTIWGEIQEQVISVSIDSTSVVTSASGPPQYSSDLIAQDQSAGNDTVFDKELETGQTAIHFSVQGNSTHSLNLSNEYQLVFVESTTDGSHFFELQTGTPSNTTLPEDDANTLRIIGHSGNVVFQTSFNASLWHNFAVLVDWSNSTLQVFYTSGDCLLQNVTDVVDNSSAANLSPGDLVIGLLKTGSDDSNQVNATTCGAQGDTAEAILYSAVFVESTSGGVSLGGADQEVVCGN
ncbi:hypothetical protein EI94DRAFT_1795989 [Lactarius quietus]|nr:hypothetical protein EI94DRAFT_1795989 [Lactarius quietus]